MKNEELILTCTKKQVLMQKIHLDPLLYTQILQYYQYVANLQFVSLTSAPASMSLSF